jgi:hypothetical protein
MMAIEELVKDGGMISGLAMDRPYVLTPPYEYLLSLMDAI